MHVLRAQEEGKALLSRSLSHDSSVRQGLGSSSLCSPFSAPGVGGRVSNTKRRRPELRKGSGMQLELVPGGLEKAGDLRRPSGESEVCAGSEPQAGEALQGGRRGEGAENQQKREHPLDAPKVRPRSASIQRGGDVGRTHSLEVPSLGPGLIREGLC